MSFNEQRAEAAVKAAELETKIKKQEAIRMMAANIYGHLYGTGNWYETDAEKLASRSVKGALAIWREVEKQV